MHRLNKPRSVSPASRAGIAKAAVALAGALIMSSACVTTQEAVPEPPYVEKLRVRITKVRGAIAETRSTITRAVRASRRTAQRGSAVPLPTRV